MTHDASDSSDRYDDEAIRHELTPRAPGQRPVRRASTLTVWAVLSALAIFLFLVRSILLPFVIAGAIAYVCSPAVERLARASRLPRWAAATLVCLLILATIGALAWLGLPSLIEEIRLTAAHLQGTIERGVATAFGDAPVRLLGRETDAKQIATQAMASLRAALGQSDIAALVVGGGVTLIFCVIFSVVLLFYFMIGGPTLARNVLWLVPPKQRPLIEAVWRALDPVLYRYFASIALVVAYASFAAYLGLAFFLRLPHAGVLAVLTGLLEMVPILGPAASAIIAGLFAIRNAVGPAEIVAYAVYAILLRLSVDQVVSPLVLGRAGRIHPVVIIFCFLAGGTLFGITGIILAVPLALTIRTVLAVLYEESLVDDPET